MLRTSRAVLALAYALLLLAVATPMLAHPMGNFSVNHYSRIKVGQGFVSLRYLIDMAEIPTFQELQSSSLRADSHDPQLVAYLDRKAGEFMRGIRLEIDGQLINFQCVDRQVIFPPGAGGLPTMKFGFTCRATLTGLGDGQHRLVYEDENFPGRAGWKELIVNADPRSHLVSSAARVDLSGELSNYPTDLLNSPPQDLVATLAFTTKAATNSRGTGNPRPITIKAQRASQLGRQVNSSARTLVEPSLPSYAGALSGNLRANVQGTPRSAFTELIGQQRLSLWFLLTAAMISIAFGALHALEPGHGKTLVAAYLVGSRGTATHAVLLGMIVTLAHTAGVYALGAITLYASQYILPEKLYPWLGAISGTIVAFLGLLLFMRRWAGDDGLPEENHKHWYDRFSGIFADFKSAPSDTTTLAVRQQVSIPQLLVLGITGGLVPCPAALVVLLSALALHRIVFGLFLIVAFSFGLAAILIGIGLLMVNASRFLSRVNPESQLVRRRLPLLSAASITIVGLALVAQSTRSAGMPNLGGLASPKWLLVAGVGLLLGMRHSTDPDHVIAVTTIVTRLASLRHASLVGMLWGIGHTLTIFIVGSAIILFGLVIPPRIGLSMEFAVALMLIVLGILNLTGVLARLTRRLSSEQSPSQPSDVRPKVRIATEGAVDHKLSRFWTYNLLRPVAIGIVHGLAGSAAVALLVLATIHNPIWAIGYLLLFGLGTVTGMMLMTTLISLPIIWSRTSFARLNRLICATSGIVSVAFGLFLIYQIGFVSGLFSSAPKWVPG